MFYKTCYGWPLKTYLKCFKAMKPLLKPLSKFSLKNLIKIFFDNLDLNCLWLKFCLKSTFLEWRPCCSSLIHHRLIHLHPLYELNYTVVPIKIDCVNKKFQIKLLNYQEKVVFIIIGNTMTTFRIRIKMSPSS